MLLITTPNYRGEVSALAKTASALGWDVYNGGWRIPAHLLHEPGAVYGEQFFCEAVADQMKWKLLSNPLDWLTKLPEEYTRRSITYTTLSEARKITERKFIKPADDKCFPAKVYESGDELSKLSIIDTAAALISDVMTFTSEYRCFVKDRKITTACCYWYKHFGKEPEIDSPINYFANNDLVIEFANKFLEDTRIECAPSAVIDIARYKSDEGLKFVVLESNPVYSSGLYGCEMVAALDSIAAACEINK